MSVMSRDAEASREREQQDAKSARASVNRAREELKQLERRVFGTGVPVTPEEEDAWIELERRRGS